MQEESRGIVIGTVTECERVPGAKRLYRLVMRLYRAQCPTGWMLIPKAS